MQPQTRPLTPPQSHTRPPPGFPDQEPRGPWSEDCLFVNVWAPSNRTRKLPVLLWLYGGGWQEGDAAQPLFDGRNLTAANDVVLVVVKVAYACGTVVLASVACCRGYVGDSLAGVAHHASDEIDTREPGSLGAVTV